MAEEAKQREEECKGAEAPSMLTRPSFKDSFKQRQAGDIMQAVLEERLRGKAYDRNAASQWTKEISTDIKEKLKALQLLRYKIMVQAVLGELGGAGVRMGARCLWDAQSDKLASATFSSDGVFCTAVAFAVYLN